MTGHPSYTASIERYEGFRDALAAVGLEADPALVLEGSYDFASGAVAGEAMLSLAHPPTAIFASNDEMAAGVLTVAHRRRIAVPSALSVAGFGDDAVAGFVWPPLTTVRQDFPTLGQRAFGHLGALLGGQTPPLVTLTRPELVVRASTAPPRSGERSRVQEALRTLQQHVWGGQPGQD